MSPPPLPSPRRRRLVVSAGLACLVGAALPIVSMASPADGFLVVVHEDVDGRAIERDDLSNLFLKKQLVWGRDGGSVTVFQPPEDDPVRDTFSLEIHGRSAASIQNYWQRQLFSGRAVPPETVDQETLLLRIAETPGAIGYVDRDAVLPQGVVRLEVVDYPLDLPYSAGAVGASSEPATGDEPIRGPAAQTDQVRVYDGVDSEAVAILDVGPCESGARRFVLANQGDHDVSTRVEISRWLDGDFKSSATKTYSLSPGEEHDLGCGAQGREHRRWALAEVTVKPDPRPAAVRQQHPAHSIRIAREAVEWVESGTCGAEREGTVYKLRNRLLDRAVRVEVEVLREAPGSSRTHLRTMVLGPGAERRLGCSLDRALRQTFTLRSADYL